MTNTVLRHDAHDIADLIVWNADNEVFSHDMLYKGGFHLLAACRAFAQNISLCDDADHFPLVVEDYEHRLEQNGRAYLFMPDGVSEALQAQVRERGVEPVLVNVSEFLRKGGGAVKCMIGDLGPDEEAELSPEQRAFLQERDYRSLFGAAGI